MLKIIGSGFGRTGTLSMKLALEQLGFGPCYHMAEIMPSAERSLSWYKIACGEPADWQEIMAGFQSTLDFPACVYYRELMATFPDAKVIHTVRDPDKWYQSAFETIFQFSRTAPKWMQRVFKPLGRRMTMVDRIVWEGVFENDFANRQHAIDIFMQHTNDVVATVPAERLLVFDVKEGWEPLCKFLDVPVPDTPFPHVNDGKAYKKRLRIMGPLLTWGPLALGFVLLTVLQLLLSGQ